MTESKDDSLNPQDAGKRDDRPAKKDPTAEAHTPDEQATVPESTTPESTAHEADSTESAPASSADESTATESESSASEPSSNQQSSSIALNEKKARGKVDTQRSSTDEPEAIIKPRAGRWLWLSLIIQGLVTASVVAAIGAGIWWFLPQWQGQQGAVAELNDQLSQQRSANRALQKQLDNLESNAQARQGRVEQGQVEVKQQVRAVTERLDVHNQRLLSLSNTSREDWLLAEAHYLLRLASQRLLVDRQATSALGLMEASDDILKQLALPDLFPVRQALADDLAAVRLAAEVDREGIYLRLAGLINNIERLPIYEIPAVTVTNQAQEQTESPSGDAWWRRALDGVGDRFNRYFSLRHHDEFAAPLLPPSAGEYLRQNLRLSLEQAQIAMLREQTAIYQASLDQAEGLLVRYFPDSPGRAALIEELQTLSRQTIAIALPQIDGSVAQLQAYIERLHQLSAKPGETSEAAGSATDAEGSGS